MSRRASSRSVGPIRELVRSWERHLRAGNRSPRTIQGYAEAALQFDAWLDEEDLPVDVGLIERRHIEAWLASLLERWKPATAAARYRSLRQFFRWLEDDGELDVSPMTKMRPPKVPEQPVPILTDDQLGALLDACTGKDFGMGQMLERRAHQAGIGHAHPHQFRHTFAHAWLAEGGAESDLMRIAGWSSPEMLSRYGTGRPRRVSVHAKRIGASRQAIGGLVMSSDHCPSSG